MSRAWQNKFIKQFEKKHSVRLTLFPDKETAKFSDGRFYSIDDIVFDIENEIQIGEIENYSDIGRDLAISESFREWLKSKQNS